MRSKQAFAWRIFIVALILRVIPVLLTRSLGIGLDDMFQYDMLARSLARGNGFRWYAYEDLQKLEPYVRFDFTSVDYDPARGVPTSFRAPLYPAILALIYLFTGVGAGRFLAARMIQAGLGALLAPLTYKVSLHLFPHHRPAAVIAAWIAACYPLLLIYPIGLATENLFFLLVLASFYFLLKVSESPSPVLHSLLAGIFLSLAILTRSVLLPFAGLAILWTWFTLKQKRSAIVIAFALMIFLIPWVVRNSLLHRKLTGIETSMGYNLYLGYHPQGNGSFLFGPSLDLVPILDDAERDQLGTQKAIGFIRSEPGRVLPLTISRLGFFFGLEKRALMYFYSGNLLGFIVAPILLAIAAVLLLPFVFISISAVLGLALSSKNVPGMILLYLLLVSYIFPHALILSEDRFHLALVPFLAILAAQTWTGGFKTFAILWGTSGMRKVTIMLAVGAIMLLCLNWGLELCRDADKIAALLGPNGNRTYFPY